MNQQIKMTIQRGENDIEVTVYMYCAHGDFSDIYAFDSDKKEVLLTNDEIEAAMQRFFEEESERYFDFISER